MDYKLIQKLGNEPGTYALVLRCDDVTDVTVGKLGALTTERGFYIYTGSAFGPGGVAARVSRHSRRDKRSHWHIVYLGSAVQLQEFWYTYDPQRRECSWCDVLSSMKVSSVPLADFGSSDCRQGCDAHLHFFRSQPSVATFRRRVRSGIQDHAEIHAVQSLTD